MRILVYNLGGPVQPAGHLLCRLNQVIGVMRDNDVDLALLQELTAGPFAFVFGLLNAGRYIARALGYHFVTDRTWGRWGIQWHTGIVAKEQLRAHLHLDFTADNPQDPHGATLARVGSLTVASLHLDSSSADISMAQFIKVLQAIAPEPPALVGGDTNNCGNLASLARCWGYREVAPPAGVACCDRLFYRGPFAPREAQMVLPSSTGISDHSGLLVELA